MLYVKSLLMTRTRHHFWCLLNTIVSISATISIILPITIWSWSSPTHMVRPLHLKVISLFFPFPSNIIKTWRIFRRFSTQNVIFHCVSISYIWEVWKCAEGSLICCDSFNWFCWFWSISTNHKKSNNNNRNNEISKMEDKLCFYLFPPNLWQSEH